MADIRTLDLNLLKTLDALLDTRSATRAAERLGLTQPAVSGMLARLREVFGDPLFVRSQRGLIPTPRAESLVAPLRQALAEIGKLVSPALFDPATAEMTVSIAATDYAQRAVVLPFLADLRRHAPGVRVAVRPIDLADLPRCLESGGLDMALVTPDMAAENLRIRRLFEETYVLAMRQGHPAEVARMDLDLFLGCDHAIMSHDGARFTGATDHALAELGLARRVVAALPSFMALIDLLRISDVIALLPRRLVAGQTGLTLCEPPLAVAGFTKVLAWHERLQRDPAQAWLRERIAAAAGG